MKLSSLKKTTSLLPRAAQARAPRATALMESRSAARAEAMAQVKAAKAEATTAPHLPEALRDGFDPRPVGRGATPKSVYGGAPTFTGFDDAKRSADLVRKDGVAQSAKYTFAKLAEASGTMPRTKAEAEAWFNEHIKPGLEKEGFAVDWVQGDKALVRTRENPQGEVVDFLRGADSGDPSYTALAWQSEGPVGGGGGSVAGVTGKASVGGSGLADRAFVLSILSKYPPTNEGIQQAVAELKRQPGYEHAVILEHPLRLDKIDFGRGVVVDVVVGSGGPSPSWGWMPE